MPGPLETLTVVELAGIGPAPYGGQVLADLGADVIRVDRPTGASFPTASPTDDLLNRNKRSIVVDLKRAEGAEIVLRLVEGAEALIEGLRPGVTERLGVGPDVCIERNPTLVYGRMTGWGQDGPLSGRAGHDIDYLAVAGALGAIGAEDRPLAPLNLVADFGGGGMLLAVGVLAGVLSARTTGVGQVVDVAMVDGVAHLTSMLHSMIAAGIWTRERRANLLDGGAPFYDTYRTADGRFMAVGALEPRFYAELLDGLDLDPEGMGPQYDPSGWPRLRARIAATFASRTRAEWEQVFAERDACVVPVLDPWEAPEHPHNLARSTFLGRSGRAQPAPAPRFAGTPADPPRPPVQPGWHTRSVLGSLGYDDRDVDRLIRTQVVADARGEP